MNIDIQVVDTQLQKADFHRKSTGLACLISILSETKEKKQKKSTDYVDEFLSPKWDAKFSFPSVESVDTIQIKYEDKSVVGPPHCYGKLKIPVSGLQVGSSITQEYQIQRKKRRPFRDYDNCGTVKLIIQANRIEKIESTLSPTPASSLKTDLSASDGSFSIDKKEKSPFRKLAPKRVDSSPKAITKSLRGSIDKELLNPSLSSSQNSPSVSLSNSASSSGLRSSSSSSPVGGTIQAPRSSLGGLNNSFLCQLFSLSEDESFFAVVRCSYFSPILIHGSLYFSTNYLCFFSRFLGKITQEVINLDNIMAVTKKLTLNSNIIVQTRSKSYNLLSFRRVDLYTLVLKAWKREGIDLSLSAEIEEDIQANELLSTEQMDDGLGFWNSKIQLTPVVQAELPLSPPVFFKKFFDDSFTRLFYERRGATEIHIDPWTKSEKFGMFREVSFRLPVDRFNVQASSVNATQRYNLQKDHLIVTSTFVFRDLPFGDLCTVEGKWDIKEISPKNSQLTAFHAVNKTGKGVTSSQEGWMEKVGTDHFENWVALVRGELVKWKTAKQKLREQANNPAATTPATTTPTNSTFLRLVDKFPVYLITFLCIGCVIGILWIWTYLSYVEKKAERLHCLMSPDVECSISVESMFSEK